MSESETREKPEESTILLVGNNGALLKLESGIRGEGHQVAYRSFGEKAQGVLSKIIPDLIILDMEAMDKGIEFLKSMRALREFDDVPILALDRPRSDNGKTAAEILNLGADRYLPNSYAPDVIIAYMHALLHQFARQNLEASQDVRQDIKKAAREVLRWGPITVDLITKRVAYEGKNVHLTPSEYKLFAHLMTNHPGSVRGREELQAVLGQGKKADIRTVDTYISRIEAAFQPQEETRAEEGPTTPPRRSMSGQVIKRRRVIPKMRGKKAKKVERPNKIKIVDTIRGVGYRLKRFDIN
jgi:two-component system KDP operon response regulator KdpE